MFCPSGSVASQRHSVVAGTLAVLALSAGLPAAALPEDAEQPIRWRADQAEGDMAARTVLTGAVRMDQGTLRVEAERMVIEYEQDKVVRIVAEGDPAHYRQLRQRDAEPVRAQARTIIYHAAEARVELIGQARLTQQGNEFRGQRISYDQTAGAIEAEDDENGVQMVWRPRR